MFPKGLIIAFEGLDCSFKETNYKEFVSRLLNTYPSKKNFIITESFPRYESKASYFLTKWLNGEYDRNYFIKQHMTFAINSMYSLDRLDFWQSYYKTKSKKMKRMIDLRNDETHCFIFDRYSYSNSLYNPRGGHSAFMPDESDFMFDDTYFANPIPDIVIWMRMRNFAVLEDLIKKKTGTDENEKNTDFIRSVWLRSEHVLKYNHINSDTNSIYIPAPGFVRGTILIPIECLDENYCIRSKESIADEIYQKVTAEADKIIKDKRKENRYE